MCGNRRVAVSDAVVRMSIGTIPHHEWRLAFDLQGYTSRCPLLYVPYWLQIRPCWSFKYSPRSLLAADENGVLLSESPESASTLSRARNSFTTASCPISVAHDNGVRSFKSLESVSTSSRARNSFTTASFPHSAANDNGVRPFESLEFGSTSSRARNSFTIASFPLLARNDNGVRPSESLEFASTSSRARN